MACVAAELVLTPLKAAAEDVREAIAMFNLVSELNATPERQGKPIRAAMVLTMTTPGTVIARHVRRELEGAGFPLLLAEVTQRVAYPELSMKGLAPSIADPEGAAARDIARVAMELMNAGRVSHVQAA
jgi:chromosome partitioning protein